MQKSNGRFEKARSFVDLIAPSEDEPSAGRLYRFLLIFFLDVQPDVSTGFPDGNVQPPGGRLGILSRWSYSRLAGRLLLHAMSMGLLREIHLIRPKQEPGIFLVLYAHGWLYYFRMASIQGKLKELDGWLRNRLRYCI